MNEPIAIEEQALATTNDLQAVLDGTAPARPNGCIIWDGGRFKSGHAFFDDPETGRRRWISHKMLEMTVGPKPDDKHVCRWTCGNPSCVAADHLYWAQPGTRKRTRKDLKLESSQKLKKFLLGQVLRSIDPIDRRHLAVGAPGTAADVKIALDELVEKGWLHREETRVGNGGTWKRHLHTPGPKVPPEMLIKELRKEYDLTILKSDAILERIVELGG